MRTVQATEKDGVWVLNNNPVWAPPLKGGKIKFPPEPNSKSKKPGKRVLVIDKEGRVYGVRSLFNLSGAKNGQVTVRGRTRVCAYRKVKFRRPKSDVVSIVPTAILDSTPA